MELYEKIIEAYPEIGVGNLYANGILLPDESDGVGAFIVKWEYSKPIPEGLSLGKP